MNQQIDLTYVYQQDLEKIQTADDRPLHLYFTRDQDLPELDATDGLMTKISSMSRRVIMCTSWRELAEMLKLNPRSICFNYKEIDHSSAVDIASMVQTMSKLVDLPYEIQLCVDVGKNTPFSTIKLLQKSNIQGIIPRPCDFGWDECVKGAEAIWAGIPYWPKHIIDQLPNTKKKPVMIYFRSPSSDDVTKGDSTVVADYNKVLPVDIVVCDGWDELDRLLLDGPTQISINSKVFTSTDTATIKETIGMLQTRLKLAGLCIPIALVVENDTARSVVLQAKQLGLQGLIPYHGDWDPADIMTALQALTDRKTHWPKHILDQLPNPPESLLNIYFREDWKEYAKTFDLKKFQGSVEMNVVMCSDWNELDQALAQNPHQLVFHITMLKRLGSTISEIMSMLETRMKLAGVEIPVAVGIDSNTPATVIKELKQAGVHGIVPAASSWGVDETVVGIHALRDRIPYWPKHILQQLPDPEKKVITGNKTIALTPRQQQIFRMIRERGATNKAIARTLKITESTVKLHVTGIFKKYGVRNRTQLAVFNPPDPV